MTLQEFKKMNVINLTPHEICLKNQGEWLTWKPSGIYARCYQTFREVDEVRVYQKSEEVEGLPSATKGTFYIVSKLILRRLAIEGVYREDLLAPDTGATAMRDQHGRITGVMRFMVMDPPDGRIIE